MSNSVGFERKREPKPKEKASGTMGQDIGFEGKKQRIAEEERCRDGGTGQVLHFGVETALD